MEIVFSHSVNAAHWNSFKLVPYVFSWFGRTILQRTIYASISNKKADYIFVIPTVLSVKSNITGNTDSQR